jgi:hypothetical protein
MASEITGTTSAELRRNMVEQSWRPAAARIFAALPEVQSVVFAVAQYWNDEAADQVHWRELPSLERDPRWPEMLTRPLYESEGDDFLAAEFVRRLPPTPEGHPATDISDLTRPLPWLDEDKVITAFASCCTEGCHQEMSVAEAYRPYAIARRDGNQGVAIEVVGRVIRPEWEDRFDVGSLAPEPEPRPRRGASADQPPTTEPPAAPKSRGFLSRVWRWLDGER